MKITDEMVERAMLVLAEADHYGPNDIFWEEISTRYRRRARAALEAALSPEPLHA